MIWILFPKWLGLVIGNKCVSNGYRHMWVCLKEIAYELAGRGCDLPDPSSSFLSHSEIHSLHRAKMNLTCQIEAREIKRGMGLRGMPVVSCSFGHHADDNTIWLSSTPILRENIRRWSEASQLSSPSTN
ncbi:hypothetical protein TNCV_2487341 [Trichonephila clavipes]|uniref:Uncharacterized protein n=1 Tax=Trichonephila clavipes TaxID=2585209 RepID=A0A8X6W014_TRICX|nr:hypothetical protein TNCV_2487341 [Trichonephila clavipes]